MELKEFIEYDIAGCPIKSAFKKALKNGENLKLCLFSEDGRGYIFIKVKSVAKFPIIEGSAFENQHKIEINCVKGKIKLYRAE